MSFIIRTIECDLDTLIESVRRKRAVQIKKSKKTILDTVQEHFIIQRKLLIVHLLLKIFNGDYSATQKAVTSIIAINRAINNEY